MSFACVCANLTRCTTIKKGYLLKDFYSINGTIENRDDLDSILITPLLAHRIRISEILSWDRKSYLNHAILPRLSREGYIHWGRT